MQNADIGQPELVPFGASYAPRELASLREEYEPFKWPKYGQELLHWERPRLGRLQTGWFYFSAGCAGCPKLGGKRTLKTLKLETVSFPLLARAISSIF